MLCLRLCLRLRLWLPPGDSFDVDVLSASSPATIPATNWKSLLLGFISFQFQFSFSMSSSWHSPLTGLLSGLPFYKPVSAFGSMPLPCHCPCPRISETEISSAGRTRIKAFKAGPCPVPSCPVLAAICISVNTNSGLAAPIKNSWPTALDKSNFGNNCFDASAPKTDWPHRPWKAGGGQDTVRAGRGSDIK